jgi:hypothetical protein
VARELPPFRLDPMPLTEEAERALGFRSADPEVGTRHRLGGEPQEGVSVPTCDPCGQDMSFYGQLDSIGDDIAIADVGLICVFLCLDCFTAKAIVSSG